MQFEQKHVFWTREVRKRRLFIIWFGCVGLSVVASLLLLRSSPGPSKLVSVNCVSTPSSTNNEATFYITNHTTKPVMAALYIIEVQDGSNWVRWGSWSSQKKLAPRTAEFETVIFARGSLLTNTWRLRGEAREISRGGATILAKAKLLPQLLWMYYGKGQTNLPLKLIIMGNTFGPPYELVTDGVPPPANPPFTETIQPPLK